MNKFANLSGDIIQPPKINIQEVENCDESSIIKSFMVRTNKNKKFLILEIISLNNKKSYITITKDYIKSIFETISSPINDGTFIDIRPKTGELTNNQYIIDFVKNQPDINDLIHSFPQENTVMSAYSYLIFDDCFAIKVKFPDNRTKTIIFPDIASFYLQEYLENSLKMLNVII
jgi:hypothetical protein